jgi:hypothetical protein
MFYSITTTLLQHYYSITTTLLPPGEKDHICRQIAYNMKKNTQSTKGVTKLHQYAEKETEQNHTSNKRKIDR